MRSAEDNQNLTTGYRKKSEYRMGFFDGILLKAGSML
jgi:hypothetical protein